MKIGTDTPRIPAPYRGSGCAFAGKTKWGRRVDVGGDIAVGDLSRDISAWIPAFAGKTNGVRRWRTRKPFKHIFVPMTNGGPWRWDSVANDEAAGGLSVVVRDMLS